MIAEESDRGPYLVNRAGVSRCCAAAAFAWSIAAAILVISAYRATGFDSPVWGPDDAMRLVQIRDLLNGQGWFDLAQKRLFPGDPVILHWSRLVDAPLAVMISGFRQIVSPDMAEWTAVFAWPLALLFALLLLTARLSYRLGGERAMWAGVLIPLAAAGTLGEFLPGRIDHHGLQIVLVLLLLWLVLRTGERPLHALLAGALAPVLLAVGLEPLPFVVAAAAAFGLRWALCRDGAARALAGFGAGMLAAAPVMYFLTVPEQGVLACDAYSRVHLAAACLGGAVLLLLGLAGNGFSRPGVRAFAALGAGGAVAAMVVYLFPECLATPYGHLGQDLKALWLSQIVEAQGARELLAKTPEKLLGYYLMPLAALVLCLNSVRRERGMARDGWMILAVFLALGLVLALYQVRGVKFALMLAVPPGAWLIAELFDRYRAMPRHRRTGALVQLTAGCALFMAALHHNVANGLASSGPAAVLGETPAGGASPSQRAASRVERACWARSALRALDALEPGLVLAPNNLGSHILLESRHAIIAANYHRGGRGILLGFELFNAPETDARKLALSYGLDYVVHCPGMMVRRADGATAPVALARAFERGQTPSWLAPVGLAPGNPLRVYRVRR